MSKSNSKDKKPSQAVLRLSFTDKKGRTWVNDGPSPFAWRRQSSKGKSR